MISFKVWNTLTRVLDKKFHKNGLERERIDPFEIKVYDFESKFQRGEACKSPEHALDSVSVSALVVMLYHCLILGPRSVLKKTRLKIWNLCFSGLKLTSSH